MTYEYSNESDTSIDGDNISNVPSAKIGASTLISRYFDKHETSENNLNSLVEKLEKKINNLSALFEDRCQTEKDDSRCYISDLIFICNQISTECKRLSSTRYTELINDLRYEIDAAMKRRGKGFGRKDSMRRLRSANDNLNQHISDIEDGHRKVVGELQTELEVARMEKDILRKQLELVNDIRLKQSPPVDETIKKKSSFRKFWRRKPSQISALPPNCPNTASVHSARSDIDTRPSSEIQLKEIAKRITEMAELKTKCSEFEQLLAPYNTPGGLDNTSEENTLKIFCENNQMENLKLKADERQCYNMMKSMSNIVKEKINDLDLIKEDMRHNVEICQQQKITTCSNLSLFNKINADLYL